MLGEFLIEWFLLGLIPAIGVFLELVLRDRDPWAPRPATAVSFVLLIGGTAALLLWSLRAAALAVRYLGGGVRDLKAMRRRQRIDRERLAELRRGALEEFAKVPR